MTEGRKNDGGKPRYDLIPARPLEALADLYRIGAEKYGERNWERGIHYGRIFRAMMSHAWKWWRGERFDQEDGQHHLSSVAWCALALQELEQTHPDLDDRPLAPGTEVPSTHMLAGADFGSSGRVIPIRRVDPDTEGPGDAA